jgi:hypothetical protein
MNDIEDEFLKEIIPDKQRSKRKKTINSKKKGGRGEKECKDIFNARFKEKAIFSRTPGSGNYVGGMNAYKAKTLSEEQLQMMTSDLFCNNKNFKFSIEHKFYTKIDFYDLFNKSSDLFKWYEQSETDAKLLGKFPLLIVKTNQHKRIAFVKIEHAPRNIKPVFVHENRCCYWLEELLKLPDEYFFD